jgi:FkbM family methyltransferase
LSVTSGNNKTLSLPVRPRRFIDHISLPFLARMRLYDPARKPRGGRKLKRKLGQFADELFHGWLNVPARGTMSIRASDDKGGTVEFDAHQSAYLAFASRQLHGGYEPAETLFLEAVLAKSSNFYDVGCNWGYFSLLAATHPVFQGPVFAFDVSVEMNAALARMGTSLELDNLAVAGYGLSDRAGTVGLSAGRSAHLTQITNLRAPGGESGRTAIVQRLDDLALPPPDLMKIDVEDHE